MNENRISKLEASSLRSQIRGEYDRTRLVAHKRDRLGHQLAAHSWLLASQPAPRIRYGGWGGTEVETDTLCLFGWYKHNYLRFCEWFLFLL